MSSLTPHVFSLIALLLPCLVFPILDTLLHLAESQPYFVFCQGGEGGSFGAVGQELGCVMPLGPTPQETNTGVFA